MAVPSSHQTVSWKVNEIIDHIVNKLKTRQSFSLQHDESTDISGQAQLVSIVIYIDGNYIKEHVLFCKKLEHTTEKLIFNVINHFFSEPGLSWKSHCCIHDQ